MFLTIARYNEGMSKSQKSLKQPGIIRKKRGDSLMGKIEKTYGKDFGIRTDMKLETFLKKAGYPSLSKMLSDV